MRGGAPPVTRSKWPERRVDGRPSRHRVLGYLTRLDEFLLGLTGAVSSLWWGSRHRPTMAKAAGRADAHISHVANPRLQLSCPRRRS
jgi:hypothetical protein